MVRRLLAVAETALAVAALPAVAAAQGQPRVPFATLEGVVADSLRGGFVSHAVVAVMGTSRYAVSDTAGRYRIDSIPPGSYQIHVTHDLLDSLGVRVRTTPVTFAADSSLWVSLGFPSARTIIRAKCGDSTDDSGALVGMVINADSEDPRPGAEVRMWWVELAVGQEIGVRYQPRQLTATTDDAGRYKFCGLPPDLSANIIARRGSDSTMAVLVEYGSGLATATLFLATADAAAPTAAGLASGASRASLRGTVTDSAGKSVPGARVALPGSREEAMTDSAGAFSLSGRSGTQALIVRKLGYRPAEVIVNLTLRTPREVVVRLNTYVPTLEAVLIEARRNFALERVGFTTRQKTGMGRYLIQTDLDRRHALVVSDFLRHLPGARASGLENTTCTSYWIDGSKWLADADEIVSPNEVGAIEVYNFPAVPPEFSDFAGACRVIVIWTKWKLGIR